MTEYTCKYCKNLFEKEKHMPILLTCGDALCVSCVKYMKDALKKDEFDCPKCCNPTKSTGIEKTVAYPPPGTVAETITRAPAVGEFEVLIRPQGEEGNYPMRVTKTMTVGQLKKKIKEQNNFPPNIEITLTFRRPLTNDDNTLESYGITKTVVITQISFVRGGC